MWFGFIPLTSEPSMNFNISARHIACVAASPRTCLSHLYSQYRRFRVSATQATRHTACLMGNLKIAHWGKSSAIEVEVCSNLFVILKNPSMLGARVSRSTWCGLIVVHPLDSHRKVSLSELVNAYHLSERMVWDDCWIMYGFTNRNRDHHR